MARASIKRCRKRARALTERAPKGTLFFGRRIRPRGRDQVTGQNFGAEALDNPLAVRDGFARRSVLSLGLCATI